MFFLTNVSTLKILSPLTNNNILSLSLSCYLIVMIILHRAIILLKPKQTIRNTPVLIDFKHVNRIQNLFCSYN